ncbi:MAG TPA: hydroxymethylglutaryl-CoA lyase [Alphaproteobacteria bacterium]|nr:hydroxymethylglutaryl-CoA lyase [Alphaproteobacteria bacterium]
MAKRFVTLVEVGPRDGLQNEPTILPTAAKVEFIRRAIDAGLKRIEAASFVNPTKVPAMADAEAVMAAVPRDRGAVYSGLVLNRRGFDRAVEAGCDEILYVTSSTESFSRRNQGMALADAIAGWHDVAREAAVRGIRASASISNAFGCPFEGRVPVSRICEIAAEIAKSPLAELTIPDTIGVAVPPQVTRMWRAVRETVGDGVSLRAHFHNTRNTAIANVYAAIEAGAEVVDASIGGIGGCPFAPRATGNVATEDVLYLLEEMGIETDVSLDRLIETAKWLEPQLGHSLPGMVSRAGGFPVARAS